MGAGDAPPGGGDGELAGGRRAGPPGADRAACFLDQVGGTCGPLIGLLLPAIAERLATGPDPDRAIVAGVVAGAEAIARVGEARAGDRTMLDCLLRPARRSARPARHPDRRAELPDPASL